MTIPTGRWRRLASVIVALLFLPLMAAAQYGNIYIYYPSYDVSVGRGESIGIEYQLDYPYDAAEYYYNTVTIEYSDDNGSSWNEIGSNISPYETYYSWTVPLSITPRPGVLIRVREVAPDPWYGYVVHYDATTSVEITRGCVAPTFYTSPETQSVCLGAPALFFVETDALNPMYEWMKDGAVIAQTYDNRFIVDAVDASTEGLYSVVVIDECGARNISANARLTTLYPPAIVSQPAPDVLVCEATRTRMAVAATGDGLTYQWYRNGSPITGARDSVFVIDPTAPSDAGQYTVEVAGTCGDVVISEATDLSVRLLPRVTRDIEPVTACNGTPVTLSIAASGSNLVYQWYRDGHMLAGETDPTLVIGALTAAEQGSYQCIVTSTAPNPLGCVNQTQSSTVTVSTFKAPTVVSQPVSQDGCIGGSATLTSAIDGFDLAYQWSRNGVAIAGATSNTLTLNNLTAADAAAYTLTVTGACGLTVQSAAATITIITPPTVTMHGNDQHVNVGETIELTVAGTDVRSIQWLKNSQLIPGATSATFRIAAASKTDAGVYNAILTNGCGQALTQYKRVRVTDPNAGGPELVLTAASADLGEVPVGYERSTSMENVITNAGTQPMTVQTVTSTSPDFVVSGITTPLVVAPGESASFTVTAAANGVGPITGSVVVTADGSNPSDAIAVSAMGVLRYSTPATVNFAEVVVDSTKELCIAVTNTSVVDLTIDQFLVFGPGAAQYTVVTPVPLMVAAGTEQDVCIRFTPSALGVQDASIGFISPMGGNSTVALSGTGNAGSSVAMDADAFGVRIHPNPAAERIAINTGTMDVLGMDIVDAQGRLVTTLPASATQWTLTDATGAPVANGLYMVRLRNRQGQMVLPLAVVR